MRAITAEDWDTILNDAGELDEELAQAYIYFTEDENYWTLFKLFDRRNFNHYDEDEEYVTVDSAKIFKKILRGKDLAEVLRFTLDLGRLVGRAEYTLKNND